MTKEYIEHSEKTKKILEECTNVKFEANLSKHDFKRIANYERADIDKVVK